MSWERLTNVLGASLCSNRAAGQHPFRSETGEVIQYFHVQWELHERDTPIPAPTTGEAPVDRNHRPLDRLRCQSHPDLCHEMPGRLGKGKGQVGNELSSGRQVSSSNLSRPEAS